ncbi:MAG: DUF2599 domain-containing protein [Propionibacteriaceae bacterium]|nr:DUF2599 domain-containing protein [Propionibacteriaceae bacterium]
MSFVTMMALPAGDHLVLGADEPGAPSGIAIVNQTGQVVGGIAPPWARDATGAAVATHFELVPGGFTQTVEHRTGGVVYPVTADPWLGFALISSATWVHYAEGWTLQVTPTAWARSWAFSSLSAAVGAADWNELYAKYRSSGLNTNLTGMRDQLICHQVFVAVRYPNKPTWNLDEWRPNVGFVQTVNAQCNPGGPKWFD